LLEAQINATIDGTLVVDPVGRMILQNRRFFEIFKIPSEFRSNAEDRLAREHASNLVKDPEAFMARIDYLNAHPMETSSDEIELKDGTTLDRYSAPIVDDAGKYYGRIWTFRDITDRKESEIALKAKTALLEAQVNSSIDAIMVVDPSDQRILQNRRLFEVFKFPIELQMDSEGSRAREHVKTQVKDPDAFTSKHAHLIAHPMEISQDEIELKDGTILDRSSSPVVGDDGKYYGRIWTLRDISGRRKLEEQYRQSQKMEAIGQLTGGIAHDFNNLLAVIIGNLDLLERQIKGNEPAVKRVHTARKASLRGADLTRRLLAFSRQEVLHPSAVDLNAVIGSVLALAAPVLGPEIQIITRLDPSIPAVFADASGLENALLNLIVNARDAMSKRGKLTITSELRNLESDESLEKDGDLKPGGYAYVAISDNGHGMTKEVAQKVFEPFFTTKSHGTGLGLSMVYGFLKQSNGTIRVYSEPGFGTTLSFLLPLFEGNVNLPSAPILEKRSADVARSTILIVDDEADLLEIASTCLTNLGHTVLTAMDGKSARQLIEERDDIALLLTDIIMPGDMTGVELAECALKIKPSLKVIYCSGFPTEALAERNMSLAEGSLLRKPYQSSELISIVSNAFASAPLVQAIKVPSFPNR
jgi:signal transduction histidine kinase